MSTGAPVITVRPLRRDAALNQELVLAAARDVIGESGTDATMDMIAVRAGVGVGTVYRRFANKEALVQELVRVILDELILIARHALDEDAGSGLDVFLHALGRSLFEHRRYADSLIGTTRSDCADTLRGLIAELHARAHHFGTINSEITLADVMTTIWALRGVVQTTGAVSTRAWERHLDIHLAGLRSTALPADLPRSMTSRQVAQISDSNRTAQQN